MIFGTTYVWTKYGKIELNIIFMNLV
jgi:hypothetical protein